MEGAVGRELPHGPKSTLADMIALGLQNRVSDISDMCVRDICLELLLSHGTRWSLPLSSFCSATLAGQEFAIERSLVGMEAEWAITSLDLRPYKLSSELAMVTAASADVVQALVDEHYARASTMSASRFAASFAKRIAAWIATLGAIQTALDLWLQVQTMWAYLEPIFSSPGMVEALPEEAHQFQSIDGRWRKLQRTAIADSRAMSMLRQQGIIVTLAGALSGMEAVMSGLRAFLESAFENWDGGLHWHFSRSSAFCRQALGLPALLLPL